MSVGALLNPNDYYNIYCHSINVDGHQGAISIQGLNGIIVDPNPLTEVGTIRPALIIKNDDTNINMSVGDANFLNVDTPPTFSLAFGEGSLANSITPASANTALGHYTLTSSTTGQQNTAIGHNSLRAMTTNSYNTAIGVDSGLGLIVGDGNTFIGVSAGAAATEYHGCILVGRLADCSASGLTNAIGIGATVGSSNTTSIGASGVKTGLGISIPQSELSFIGQYQQSVSSTSHGSITDMKKRQVTGTFTATGGGGDTLVWSLPFNMGSGAINMITNFTKVSILYQISIDGTIGGASVDSSVGVSYSLTVLPPDYPQYSILGSGTGSPPDPTIAMPITGIQQRPFGGPGPTITSMSWQINSLTGALELHTVFLENYSVQYYINYETFGVQV